MLLCRLLLPLLPTLKRLAILALQIVLALLVLMISAPTWAQSRVQTGAQISSATAWNEGLNSSWLRMEMPLTSDESRTPVSEYASYPAGPPATGLPQGSAPSSDVVPPADNGLLTHRDDQPYWPTFATPFHLGFDVERTRVRPVSLVLDDAGKRTDLSVFDMQHNFELFSKGYGALFKELRVLIVNRDDLLPVFSLYRPSSDLCYLGINRSEQQWRRLTEKLNLFDPSDDLTVIQEIAAAHEVGHCVAGSYLSATNQRWSITQRELFADVFALLHIQVQFADNDLDRFNAFNQLARFRAGGPKDATGPRPRQLAAIFEQMEADGVTLLGVVGAIDLLVERVVGLMGVGEAR